MLCYAERGYATVNRPSVRPSVTLRYLFHTGCLSRLPAIIAETGTATDFKYGRYIPQENFLKIFISAFLPLGYVKD